MNDASTLQPLTPEELTELDDLLMSRVEDGDDTSGMDEGVVNLPELDGLFTALCSGPLDLASYDWLSAVWGELEPEWEDEDDYADALGLLQRHLNTICATLEESPEAFEPLFLEYEEDGESLITVDDWCEGYVRGVALASKAWKAQGEAIQKLLTPIRAFSSATEWRAHNQSSDAEFEKLSDAIIPNVRAIYGHWHPRHH